MLNEMMAESIRGPGGC